MSATRITLRPRCDLCQNPAMALVFVPGGCTCVTNEYQRRCRQHMDRLADTDPDYSIVEAYRPLDPIDFNWYGNPQKA